MKTRRAQEQTRDEWLDVNLIIKSSLKQVDWKLSPTVPTPLMTFNKPLMFTKIMLIYVNTIHTEYTVIRRP